MVTKVVINNRRNTPLRYLCDLKNFMNGKEFKFNEGINVIVGENGSGKTTLMKLIEHYLMVDYTECFKGAYNCNINRLFHNLMDKDGSLLDGVDVYADYAKNTFRLSHQGEKVKDQALNTFEEFVAFSDGNNSSTGEGVLVSLNYLFNYMFSKKAKLAFDYEQFKENYPQYVEYVNKHRVECANEFTILMDEPDRNLSLENISQIKGILSYHKPNTQIIAVIHNPLLIYALSGNSEINFIEMTKGYINKIKKEVNKLIK